MIELEIVTVMTQDQSVVHCISSHSPCCVPCGVYLDETHLCVPPCVCGTLCVCVWNPRLHYMPYFLTQAVA